MTIQNNRLSLDQKVSKTNKLTRVQTGLGDKKGSIPNSQPDYEGMNQLVGTQSFAEMIFENSTTAGPSSKCYMHPNPHKHIH